MTNQKKKKSLFDIDDIKSGYCCSFVRGDEGEISRLPNNSVAETQDTSVNGTEVREFYESLLQKPCSSYNENNKQIHDTLSSSSKPRLKNKRLKEGRGRSSSTIYSEASSIKKIEGEEADGVVINEELYYDFVSTQRRITKLLSLCFQGNLEEVEAFTESLKITKNYNDIINGCDHYGWNAIMCAAVEGHLDIVKHLLREGCLYKDVVENSERDVFQICKEKGNGEILEYLLEYDRNRSSETHTNIEISDDEEETNVIELMKCDTCGVEYPKAEHKSHIVSMIHLFKDESKSLGVSYGIPDHNKGFQMLLRSGWDVNQGLGPEGSGRKNPVKTVLKKDRLGLGTVCDSKKRVSHFSAFDASAVKQGHEKRLLRKSAKRTYERKKMKEKAWERNMRHYMSSDF